MVTDAVNPSTGLPSQWKWPWRLDNTTMTQHYHGDSNVSMVITAIQLWLRLYHGEITVTDSDYNVTKVITPLLAVTTFPWWIHCSPMCDCNVTMVITPLPTVTTWQQMVTTMSTWRPQCHHDGQNVTMATTLPVVCYHGYHRWLTVFTSSVLLGATGSELENPSAGWSVVCLSWITQECFHTLFIADLCPPPIQFHSSLK